MDIPVEIRYAINLSNRANVEAARGDIIIVDVFMINTSELIFVQSFSFGPAKNSGSVFWSDY